MRPRFVLAVVAASLMLGLLSLSPDLEARRAPAPPDIYAQSIFPNPPWCDGCFIAGYVDLPGAGNSFIRDTSTVFAGWAAVCENGRHIDQIAVRYMADNGFYVAQSLPIAQFDTGLFRPDVDAALSGPCPGFDEYSGYHAYVDTSSVPTGTRWMAVITWSQGLQRADEFLVTVQ